MIASIPVVRQPARGSFKAASWCSAALFRVALAAVLVVINTFSTVSAARAEGIPAPTGSWSAEITARVAEDMVEIQVWHDDGRWRQEVRQGDGETVTVVIVRPDTDAVYVFDGGEDTGIVLPYDPAQYGGLTEMPELESEVEGKETVNGVATTRYRFSGLNPLGEPVSGTAWISERGVPMRVIAVSPDSTGTREVQTLEIGPVDTELFEPPVEVEFEDLR